MVYNQIGKNITSRIQQGSVLGPILFLIFINGLPESIEGIVKLFAGEMTPKFTISPEKDKTMTICRKIYTEQ